MKSGANSEDVSPELVCLAESTALEHTVKTIVAFLTGCLGKKETHSLELRSLELPSAVWEELLLIYQVNSFKV